MDNYYLKKILDKVDKAINNFVGPKETMSFRTKWDSTESISQLDNTLAFYIIDNGKQIYVFNKANIIGNYTIELTLNPEFVDYYILNSGINNFGFYLHDQYFIID